jgi:drug/metabolite transporter (DMT)-like permease
LFASNATPKLRVYETWSIVLPIALALAASLSWGMSSVLVRWALRDIATAPGTLISLVAGLAFATLAVLIFYPGDLLHVSLEAILLFSVIGILNFPIGRYFNYLSISHLGVGRSAPIVSSSPLYAMALSILFVGEALSLPVAIGTLFILAGIYVTLKAPRA